MCLFLCLSQAEKKAAGIGKFFTSSSTKTDTAGEGDAVNTTAEQQSELDKKRPHSALEDAGAAEEVRLLTPDKKKRKVEEDGAAAVKSPASAGSEGSKRGGGGGGGGGGGSGSGRFGGMKAEKEKDKDRNQLSLTSFFERK